MKLRAGTATVALQATVAHTVVTRQEPSRTHGPRAPAPGTVDRLAGTTRDIAALPATALKPMPTPPTHTQQDSNHMVDQLSTAGTKSRRNHLTAPMEPRTTTPTEDITKALATLPSSPHTASRATLPNSPLMVRATAAGTRMDTDRCRPLRHQHMDNHHTAPPMAKIPMETTRTDMDRAPLRHNTAATLSQATPLAILGELHQPNNKRLTNGVTKLPKP